ncbi:TetR/AcrR family transcriptional regulator [Nocardia harenae]|uniref:TetR/AcrR family transcriptional regulator n=1 Tax=Nocardia harenae TaxID=358707 RepID=UPI0008368230|nr:TetR/AcrR family transcriptional regulator [Nocardia harenae]
MSDWLAGPRTELAADRILDGVRSLFRARGLAGVSGVGMAEVAAAAGCSRATLYRYFPNRQALFVAFADREAQRVVARVWRERGAVADPAALLDTLIAVLAAVRGTEYLAVWFEPVNAGVVAQLADSSDAVELLARNFVASLRPDLEPAAARRLGRWLVRSVVSLLTMPAEPDEERELLRAFVIPFLESPRIPV